tara:strand:- start:1000 stop:1614 length:615 start_codon:yes stop_codon:yes gene_type:complete
MSFDIQTYSLFPTNLVRTDFKGFITPQDHQEMMDSVDMLIENGVYTDNDLTPKYQTSVVLFQDNAPPIWQKLKSTFYQACENYLKATPDFTGQQDSLAFTHSGAWCYKGWRSLNNNQSNPWHHHNPAFLSGVYYLKVPGDGSSGGTEFHDPRTAPALGGRFQSIPPQEYTWAIFPGWLSHKSNFVDTDEARYVIAANMYVKVDT